MVVRVLHEGQYEVDAGDLDQLNALDQQAFDAVAEGDEPGYRNLFNQILEIIRGKGRPLGIDDLRPSELVLPSPDSTMEEVRSLFTQAGLIHSV